MFEYAGSILNCRKYRNVRDLMNNEDIHRINKQYRGVDQATDVISFAIEDSEDEDGFSISHGS